MKDFNSSSPSSCDQAVKELLEEVDIPVLVKETSVVSGVSMSIFNLGSNVLWTEDGTDWQGNPVRFE